MINWVLDVVGSRDVNSWIICQRKWLLFLRLFDRDAFKLFLVTIGWCWSSWTECTLTLTLFSLWQRLSWTNASLLDFHPLWLLPWFNSLELASTFPWSCRWLSYSWTCSIDLLNWNLFNLSIHVISQLFNLVVGLLFNFVSFQINYRIILSSFITDLIYFST